MFDDEIQTEPINLVINSWKEFVKKNDINSRQYLSKKSIRSLIYHLYDFEEFTGKSLNDLRFGKEFYVNSDLEDTSVIEEVESFENKSDALEVIFEEQTSLNES